MDNKEIAFIRAGARALLEAPDSQQQAMARVIGIEILPEEDILGALARTRKVSREHIVRYFEELAAPDSTITDAHFAAFPTNWIN